MPYFSFLSYIFGAFRTTSAAAEGSSQPAPISASQTVPSNAAKRTPSNPFQHTPAIKRARFNGSAAFNPAANGSASPILSNVFDHSRDSSSIRNIPALDTTIFSAPKATAPRQIEASKVEMTDAMETNSSPPSVRSSSFTPSLKADNDTPPTSSDETSRSKTAKSPFTAPSGNREIHTHTKSSTRPILHPIPQKNRLPARSKRDILSEITVEVDGSSGALPSGYIGTWKGMRLYELDYGSPGCGAGRHELVCGHFVECGKTKEGKWEPCGINCVKPKFHVVPYNCPQCLAAIKDTINRQLAECEKNKLEETKKAGANHYIIGYMVEYAIKYTKLTSNITETVQALLDPSFGRKCETCPPPLPPRRQTAEDIVRGLYERRDRKAWEKKNEGNKGSKRKVPKFEREAEDKKTNKQKEHEYDAGAHEKPCNTHYKAITYDELFTTKRRRLSPLSAVDFGTAAFCIPPTNTVGTLARKRPLSLRKTVEIREDKNDKVNAKRRKSDQGVGDGDNEPKWEPRIEPITKIRASFPMFGEKVGTEDEEL